MPVVKSPPKPKADKEKPYDVIVSAIYDNREGFSKAVEKPTRYSFATEEEALDLITRLREIAERG